MSKTVKSISKVIAIMGISVIGAFLILNNSKKDEVNSLNKSIIKSDTTLIDSIIIKEICEDSIIVNDTVFSDTLNTIK